MFGMGSKTWSLALGQEHRLKIFEKKVLRRTFGPKRDDIIGGWKKCIQRKFIIRTFCHI
jgi:hypothetical protein